LLLVATVDYRVVDLDLETAGDNDVSLGAVDGALVVARRGGVPIGSRLFHGPLPPRFADVVAQLSMRRDDPPGPTGRRMHMTVAVCTRNRPALLSRCLRSIAAAAAAATEEVELDLLVVDNDSDDDTTRQVADNSGARCERELIPGLDFARNRAVRESRGELIAFVDDDVVVDEVWLRTLARSFAAHPEAPAISGQVLAMRLDTPARVDFERSGGFSLGWEPTGSSDGSGLMFRSGIGVGCNMAFRRDCLVEVGPFDNALDTGRPLPGGGDLDIMIRMVTAGGVIYEPSAVVFHEHRRTWSELRYQYYTWGKSWAAVLDKWYRLEPGYRPRIRSACRATMRGYASAFVRGPHMSGGYRRWHCALLGIGFVVGWTGVYGRSVRRVAARRRRVAESVRHATQPTADRDVQPVQDQSNHGGGARET
jgi:glycosyltransferase involved in cell wall biosynthesis